MKTQKLLKSFLCVVLAIVMLIGLPMVHLEGMGETKVYVSEPTEEPQEESQEEIVIDEEEKQSEEVVVLEEKEELRE